MKGASPMQTLSDVKSLAVRYIEAAGNKDYDTLSQLLSPELAFKGPNMQSQSAQTYLSALKRMSPVWTGNAVREVFADGDRVCIFYDFITNTPAGSIPMFELLTIHDEQIASVELF